MAKRAKAADDDVPGIYSKRKPIPLKVAGRSLTAAERKAARAAFDSMVNQPPWAEWFATIGPWLVEAAASDDAATSRDAQQARHLWQWCESQIEANPAAEKMIRNAMMLGKLIERVQVRPLEGLVRNGRKQVRHADNMRDAKAEAAVVKRKDKRLRAEAALQWARENFPTAAHDDYVGFLKNKAAKHIGVSRDTLDRHLGY